MLTHYHTIKLGSTELDIEYSWDDEEPVDLVVHSGKQDITDLVCPTVMKVIEEQCFDFRGEDMASYNEYRRDMACMER